MGMNSQGPVLDRDSPTENSFAATHEQLQQDAVIDYCSKNGPRALRQHVHQRTGRPYVLKCHDASRAVLIDLDTLAELTVPALEFFNNYRWAELNELAPFVCKDPVSLAKYNRCVGRVSQVVRQCLMRDA